MNSKWTRYLVDPETGEPLQIRPGASAESEIESGDLFTPAGRAYPVVRGVPRFVPADLYSESPPDGDNHETVQFYKKFWEAEPNRSLGQAAPERQEYEPRMHALLGVNSSDGLRELFRDGMNCLNAGCGVGWSEYLFNVNEKANRFCVDMSTVVDQAYAHTRSFPNVFAVQADLFKLPFPADFFDMIFSSGVLHHTGDAAAAFAALARHLRTGGLLGIYVYKVKPLLRELADQEIKRATTQMSLEELRDFCEQIALLGRSLQRITQPLIIDQDVPLLGVRRGEYKLQKFIFDHFLKCFFNSTLGLDYSTWANIDWYGPEIATHHTREEVTSWFVNNGISTPNFVDLPGWEHSGFFVSGRKDRTP